jgi:hypothetical protein
MREAKSGRVGRYSRRGSLGELCNQTDVTAQAACVLRNENAAAVASGGPTFATMFDAQEYYNSPEYLNSQPIYHPQLYVASAYQSPEAKAYLVQVPQTQSQSVANANTTAKGTSAGNTQTTSPGQQNPTTSGAVINISNVPASGFGEDFMSGVRALFSPSSWGVILQSGNMVAIAGLLGVPMIGAYMYMKGKR